MKLTRPQRDLLAMAADPVFRISGLRLHGGREFRIAQALVLKDLAHINTDDQLTLTTAGRAMLDLRS